MSKTIDKLMEDTAKIPGGYVYGGAASYQICFPLEAGGELRFCLVDETDGWSVDLYNSELPPGISGFVKKTGEKKDG